MKNIEHTCDYCGRKAKIYTDLNRLPLYWVNIVKQDSFEKPPRIHDFCSIVCMSNWMLHTPDINQILQAVINNT